MPRAKIFAAKHKHGEPRRFRIVLHKFKSFENGVLRAGQGGTGGKGTGVVLAWKYFVLYPLRSNPGYLQVFCISSTLRLNGLYPASN